MRDYSQHGEQAWLASWFNLAGPGTFIDIGAVDGECLSNTRALALAGWHGTCVEPNPVSFAKLAKLYSGQAAVRCVHAGIGPLTGVADFFPCLDDPALSTFERTFLEQWGSSRFGKVPVKIISPLELVQLVNVGVLDFLNIDAEGYDEEIIKGWPMAVLRPRLIIAEAGSDPRVKERMTDYLVGQHHFRVAKDWGDNVAWQSSAN